MVDTTVPHALLWHGRTVRETDDTITMLFESLNIAPVDRSILDGSTLTVAEATAMKQFAIRSPHTSAKKAIIILHADELSNVVANALLKLIEEPPSFLIIRLNAERASSVLPTIRSRCQLQYLPRTSSGNSTYPLAGIDAMSLTDQLALADTLAKDEQLPTVVTFWLGELEADLLRGEPVDASIALGQVLQDRLRSNANRRIVLESWFVNRYAHKSHRS